MRTSILRHLAPYTFMVVSVTAALCYSAVGSGVVTNCAQSDLQDALWGGGTVTFACSGSITLTNTISVVADTTLDGGSGGATISGGGAVRIFEVSSNVSFMLTGITLADGKAQGANGADGSVPGRMETGLASLTRVELHVVLAAPAGSTWILVTSTDLSDWIPVSTNTASANNIIDWLVPATSSIPRLYRASKL